MCCRDQLWASSTTATALSNSNSRLWTLDRSRSTHVCLLARLLISLSFFFFILFRLSFFYASSFFCYESSFNMFLIQIRLFALCRNCQINAIPLFNARNGSYLLAHLNLDTFLRLLNSFLAFQDFCQFVCFFFCSATVSVSEPLKMVEKYSGEYGDELKAVSFVSFVRKTFFVYSSWCNYFTLSILFRQFFCIYLYAIH